MGVLKSLVSRNVRITSSYFPFITACYVLYYLSSQTRLPNIDIFIHMDKVLHFIAFFFLGGLAGFATWVRRINGASIVWVEAWLLASFYGMLDEIHQRFVPGRHSSWGDWIADTIGALVGAFLIVLLMKRLWSKRDSIQEGKNTKGSQNVA